MKGIFVSYRRSDAHDVTGRIYDRLTARYQRAMVVKDVDSIPAGTAFATYIVDTIRQSAVQLAIIGPGWLYATDHAGARRLDDPADFVRVEIESALREGIPVIPVLVSGASLPVAADLPQSLRTLTERNALQVRPDPDFNVDIERLLKAIDLWIGGSRPLTPQPSMTAHSGAQGYPDGWYATQAASYPAQPGFTQPAHLVTYPVVAKPALRAAAQPRPGGGGSRFLGGSAYLIALVFPGVAIIARTIGLTPQDGMSYVWPELAGAVLQLILAIAIKDRFIRFSAAQAFCMNVLFGLLMGALFVPLAIMAVTMETRIGASDNPLAADPGSAYAVLTLASGIGLVSLFAFFLQLTFAIIAFAGTPARFPLLGRLAARWAGVPRK